MGGIVTPRNKSVLAEYMTKTIKIEDEYEVTIKKLSGQDQMDLSKITDDMERGIETILKCAIRWTFTNIDGSALALTRDNLLRVRGDILTEMGLECIKYNNPVKEKKDGTK